MTDATDLRAAALSDLRYPPTNDNDAGLLAVLLPDVPGAPYGGTATPDQRDATTQATGTPVPEQYSTGTPVRPVHLREILRRWAASHTPVPAPAPAGDLREQLADLLQDNIPGFYPDHLKAADALLSIYAIAPRGSDNAAGLRGALQKLQTLDEDGRPAHTTD
jgi:hypothetical protein